MEFRQGRTSRGLLEPPPARGRLLRRYICSRRCPLRRRCQGGVLRSQPRFRRRLPRSSSSSSSSRSFRRGDEEGRRGGSGRTTGFPAARSGNGSNNALEKSDHSNHRLSALRRSWFLR